MKSHLLKSELNTNIKNSYNSFRKICEDWRLGFLSTPEMQNSFMQIFNKGFHKFLMKKHVYFRFDSEAYYNFLEDFDRWQVGKQPSSFIGKPWLYYDKFFDDETSISDKIAFFELMKAFHIPPHYFQPIPDGIITPDDHPGHFSNDIIIGWNIWVDDGGLLEKNFKLGDCIILTDHYGLKTQIQITECLISNEEKDKVGVYTRFVGFGSVEGYTASKRKKIYIDVYNDHIHSLLLTMDSDDLLAFHNFYLWQEALEYRHKTTDLEKSIIFNLMQYFIKENER